MQESDIRHFEVNYGRNYKETIILNLIKLKIFRAYSYLKHLILFYSKGIAIWYGLLDISHIGVEYDYYQYMIMNAF